MLPLKLMVPRPRSLSSQPTDGASCLSLLLSKESQSGGELLAGTGGAIFRAAFNAAVVLTSYSWTEVGLFFWRLFALGRASAVFLSAVLHSAVTRVTHPLIFSPRMIHLHCDEKSWEPHVDGRFQLGMSLKEVRPGHGTSLRAGPHPGAVDVSGLFHQTVTNCRGRESVCGLWPLPFHFFSSCAGIASLAPSDRATQPTHLHPRSFI